MSVGASIRGARERAAMTQGELAKAARVAVKTIGNIEADRVTPNAATLLALSRALGL